MVEYIDEPINHLAWQVAAKSSDMTAVDCCGECIISGSKNNILIWKFIDTPGSFDQLPLIEVACEKVDSSAIKVQLIGNLAFATLIDGTVLLYELVPDRHHKQILRPISKTTKLHPGYKCNDMLFCAQINSVITCGNDGAISRFNIEHPEKVTTKHVSESSLKCMDMITPNEIICGTQIGCLKLYDLRTYESVGTLENHSLSSIMCLQRNPNVNHLAVGGNNEGSIIIYDLRNRNSALAQISAHQAAVTNVRYHPRNPNILCSSSCDGELFKWNLNIEFTADKMPRKLESISCLNDIFSITSFDVNQLGDLVYVTDHGALHYTKLNELGS